MEEFMTLIANVGFPIVIAAYLLVRMEQKMDNLTIAINELAHNLGSNNRNNRLN